MEIKDILKNKRIELGLTMAEVAQKVGVSEATISRWESGEIANMRRDKIAALAQVLKISPSVIMGWEDPQKTQEYIEPDDDIIRIQRARSKMNDSEKAHMMETLKMVYTKYFTEGYDEDTEE